MDAIFQKQKELTVHPVYNTLNDIEGLRHFMEYHVYAVWDFMTLLKSLQRQITCVTLPWRPSIYPAPLVRLINQIVLGEESDVTQDGEAISHFELYLKSMEEVGASTEGIRSLLEKFDLNQIPKVAREFVAYNLDLAENGHVVEVAANFFFGREKLIPDMFTAMVETLNREGIEAPTFLYYLKRHIEVDSEEHGPLALQCLNQLINGNPELQERAFDAGLKALEMRQRLWDGVLSDSGKLTKTL